MTDLKDFRRSVAVLKKQGLISGRTQSGQKVDARSALPSWKVKGKRLDTLVKKYDDIISGKATALKIPPKTLKQFRKTGFETVQGRLLVPHTSREIVKFSKGQVNIKDKSGIERVQLPVEFHNLTQYLTDLEKNSKLIDSMKKGNEYFGIRFHGGQRAHFYSSIKQVVADLRHYEDIKKYTGKKKQQVIYQNLEIIKMTKPAAFRLEEEIHTRKRTMTKAYNRMHAKKVYKRRLGKGKAFMRKYYSKKAQAMREYRARLKRNPAADAHYKKEAKARQKKSYKKLHKPARKKVAKKTTKRTAPKRTVKRKAKRKK